MVNDHLIDNVVFDITFATEEEAFARQAELSDFAGKRLLKVIDEVFCRMSGPGQRVQIEYLEIDLGIVPFSTYQEDMEERLEKRLGLLLKDRLPLLGESTPRISEGVISRQRADCQELCYFLMHAHLPWQARFDPKRSLDALIERVIATESGRFLTFLQETRQQKWVGERLSRQFSKETLDKIIVQLAPSHSFLLSGLADYLVSIFSSNGLSAIKQQLIQHHLICEILQRANVPLQERIHNLIVYLARHEGVQPEKILEILDRTTEYEARKNTLSQHLTVIIRKLRQEPGNVDGAGHPVPEAERGRDAGGFAPVQSDLLQRRLTKALLDGAAAEITDLWPQLQVEGGNRFNKRSSLGGLLRQMAAHDNTDYQDLLVSLTRVLSQSEAASPLKSELLMLLGELADSASTPTVAKEAEASGKELLRACGLCHQLKEHLLGRKTGDVLMIIEELATTFPAQLLNLFMELESGKDHWGKVLCRLQSGELERLITFFLILRSPAGGSGQEDLRRAILTWAERSPDLKYFYSLVLVRLLDNKTIDFDEISKEQGDSVQKEEGPVAQLHAALKNSPRELPQAEEEAAEIVVKFLLGQTTLMPVEVAWLEAVFRQMMRHWPSRFKRLLEISLKESTATARLVTFFSEYMLSGILALLKPTEHDSAQRCAAVIASCCYLDGNGAQRRELLSMKWRFIFLYLVEEGRPFQTIEFVRLYTAYLAGKRGVGDVKKFAGQLREQLTASFTSASGKEFEAVRMALLDCESKEKTVPPASGKLAESVPEPAPEPKEPEEKWLEEITIDNAGQVLASPYLPRLFSLLGLTTEKYHFCERKAAERAVHLLQFMVNGRTDAPEYQLVLNKILCGVRTGIPIDRKIEITTKEREAIEGMLAGMIQNWKAIGNTSIAGLRESFLQRQGRLVLSEDGWHLLVEGRPFDMLLDQLPWSFSFIKHPWMEKVLRVEWRN